MRAQIVSLPLAGNNLSLLGLRWKHRPNHVFLFNSCLGNGFTFDGLDFNNCGFVLSIVSVALQGCFCHLGVAHSRSTILTLITQCSVVHLRGVLSVLCFAKTPTCTVVGADFLAAKCIAVCNLQSTSCSDIHVRTRHDSSDLSLKCADLV